MLDVDGVVTYDLQDEGDRNDEKRTFEFVKTIDPYEYYKSLELKFPGIIYKSVGKYSPKISLYRYIKINVLFL